MLTSALVCESQTDAAYSSVGSTITKELYVLSLTSLLQAYVLCLKKSSVLTNFGCKNSEYDQKIPQPQTADKPVAS